MDTRESTTATFLTQCNYICLLSSVFVNWTETNLRYHVRLRLLMIEPCPKLGGFSQRDLQRRASVTVCVSLASAQLCQGFGIFVFSPTRVSPWANPGVLSSYHPVLMTMYSAPVSLHLEMKEEIQTSVTRNVSLVYQLSPSQLGLGMIS